jgi:hypothetical protein
MPDVRIKTVSKTTLKLAILGIMTVSITTRSNDTQHKDTNGQVKMILRIVLISRLL